MESERIDLTGKTLIIYRPDEHEPNEVAQNLARHLAQATDLIVAVLPDGQTLEALSDEQLKDTGLLWSEATEWRVLNTWCQVVYGPKDRQPSPAEVWDGMDHEGAPHDVQHRLVGKWYTHEA